MSERSPNKHTVPYGQSGRERTKDPRKTVGATPDLAPQQEENSLFFDHASDMLCIVGFDTCFKRVNPAFTRILGWTAEELLGRPFTDFVHPADREESLRQARAHEAGKDVVGFENRYLCKDGICRWVSWSSHPLVDKQLIVGIGRDITERKLTEDELRQSETMLARAQEMARVGHWERDLLSQELLWSDELYHIFGLEPGCALSREVFLDHVHPEDRSRVEGAIQDVVEGVRPYSEVFRIVRPDGAIHWLHSKGEVAQSPEGTPRRIFGMMLDITERTLAQEAVRASEERYRSLVDLSPECILVHRDGLIRYINAAGASLLRVGRPNEAIGRAILDIVPPYRREAAKGRIRQVMEEGLTTPLSENEYLRFDGTSFWGEATGNRIIYDGQPSVQLIIRDVTERRQMEQELRQSERLYRAIGESIDYGVWVCAPDGRNIYASESFLKMVGQTQEECSSFGWGNVLHPDDAGRTIAAWQECVRTEGVWDVEHRYRGVDGKYHHVLARGIPVRDEEGRIFCWAGINLDIDRLKQVEQELRQSEERYRLLAETMPQGVVHQDANGRIISMNPAAEQILGKNPADFLGHTSLDEEHDTVGPDGTPFPGPDQPAMRTLATGERISDVVMGVFNPREQAYRWINIHAVPLFETDGTKVREVYTVFEDITERKHAEEGLRKSLERLDIISSTASRLLESPDPQKAVSSLCRRVMEHLGCDVFFNFLVDEGMNRLHLNACAGIPEETARHIHFLDFGVAVCGCAARDACRIVAENIPNTPDIRTDLVRSFGVKAYACHPLFARGRVIGTLSFGTKSRFTFGEDELSLMKIVADLVATAMERIELLQKAEQRADELQMRVLERTEELQRAYDRLVEETKEREKAEAQLRQAQKMEALGTLAGGIAHDFNNILAAIIGFSELVKDHLPEGNKDRRYIDRVLQAGIRGRSLVKQMLTFSRQTEDEKRPLQLSRIIKETVNLLRASLPTTVSIRFNVASESGVILGDPVQIQQVVMNLATNAAYAMREKGGTLDIELSDFSVSFSNVSDGMKPGDYMKLTVRDKGIGIAPDIKDRIFDPFFTTKTVGGGTGLGLSVVQGIVKQAHGYITVESEVGKGSTFTVYFPNIQEESRTQGATSEDIPTGSERILFVDDEEAIVEMGKELLAELGYEVVSRTSSRAALALFRLDPTRFDLVLTDQTMPDITGVELAREMRTIRPDIPIILCTGFSHTANEETARAAGMKGFVMKPLSKREIAKTVRKVLDERT